MSSHAIRFEIVGYLYYRRFHRLRPGMSEPTATYRDSSSDENRTQFDQWFATQSFTDALNYIAELKSIADQERQQEVK